MHGAQPMANGRACEGCRTVWRSPRGSARSVGSLDCLTGKGRGAPDVLCLPACRLLRRRATAAALAPPRRPRACALGHRRGVTMVRWGAKLTPRCRGAGCRPLTAAPAASAPAARPAASGRRCSVAWTPSPPEQTPSPPIPSSNPMGSPEVLRLPSSSPCGCTQGSRSLAPALPGGGGPPAAPPPPGWAPTPAGKLQHFGARLQGAPEVRHAAEDSQRQNVGHGRLHLAVHQVVDHL
jgi:hypothetical protein